MVISLCVVKKHFCTAICHVLSEFLPEVSYAINYLDLFQIQVAVCLLSSSKMIVSLLAAGVAYTLIGFMTSHIGNESLFIFLAHILTCRCMCFEWTDVSILILLDQKPLIHIGFVWLTPWINNQIEQKVRKRNGAQSFTRVQNKHQWRVWLACEFRGGSQFISCVAPSET